MFSKIVSVTLDIPELEQMQKEVNEWLSTVKFLQEVTKMEQTVINITNGKYTTVLVVLTIFYTLDKGLIYTFEKEKAELISQLEFYKWDVNSMADSLFRHSAYNEYGSAKAILKAIEKYGISKENIKN